MRYSLILLLFIALCGNAQEFNFDIHNTSLEEYLRLEELGGGEKIPNTSRYLSNTNAQPIRYLNDEVVIPDLITAYFFKKSDSSMSHIEYEWDVNNFEKQQNNQKSEEFNQAIISKYETLKIIISEQLGEPEVKKNYSNISMMDSVNTFVESSKWHPNDNTEVELYTTVSNLFRQEGAITINPVHRIRLYIRNTAKQKVGKAQQLDEDRIDKLSSITKDFLKSLESGNLGKCKEFFIDQLKEQVTDEQLISLTENIDFNDKIELQSSGVRVMMDGNSYAFLSFKYGNDTSNTPTTLINVIFGNDNKIAGIQPVQRSRRVRRIEHD